MANEDIAFKIEVDGVEKSINSVKDLKNAIKAAKDEQLKAAEAFGIGSKQYENAAKKVSALKDKVEDLGDSTKSLAGSGVERASAGFSQLGEGLKNLDFDKVKVGLTAMKSALAAVGIGLIVQAVMYLVENFDSLSKGSGVLAKILQWVGTIVTGLKDALYDLADNLGLVNKQLDDMSDAITKLGAESSKVLGEQISRIDRLTALAKANGESTVKWENLKQEAIIRTNKFLVEQTIEYVKAGGVLDDKQKEALTAALNNITNAKNQQQVIEITAEKAKNDELKKINEKHREDLKRINEQEADDWWAKIVEEQKAERDAIAASKKAHDDLIAYNRNADDENRKIDNDEHLVKAQLDLARNREDVDRKVALLQVKRDIELQNDLLTNEQRKLIEQNHLNEVSELKKTANAKDNAEKKAALDGGLQLTQTSLQSAQQLTDLFFEYKKSKLAKGSAEELAAAKKQFEINKALQISMAVISGVQGVIAAYSSGSAIPIIGAVAGPAFAILAGIAAAANIAKIASTKFGGGGGGGGAAAPSSPNIPIPSPPGISTKENNTSTKFDENGKKQGSPSNPVIQVNATVGVDEIAAKQNRVTVLEKQSTF